MTVTCDIIKKSGKGLFPDTVTGNVRGVTGNIRGDVIILAPEEGI